MLLSLPTELIIKILQYFSIKEILQCTPVNTLIYEIIKQNTFNENTHNSIVKNLSFIKRVQSAKQTVIQRNALTFECVHLRFADNGNIIIYTTNDLIGIMRYNAYQYTPDLKFIGEIKDIYGFDDNRYVTFKENKLYVNGFYGNINNIIDIKLKDENVAISGDYIVCYDPRKLLITNLLTNKTIKKKYNDIYNGNGVFDSLVLFSNHVIIVIKTNKYILLKYDLITLNIICECTNKTFDENYSTLDIISYDGKYFNCFICLLESNIKVNILFDIINNKLVYSTPNENLIVNLKQNEICDIDNVISTQKINSYGPPSHLITTCMKSNVLVGYYTYYDDKQDIIVKLTY